MADKGNMSVRDAGRKGGKTTSATHDHGFYEEIGHIGHKGGTKGGPRVRELIEEGKNAENSKQ